jgi:periplasmic mercuric ion binding protein
MKSKIGLAIAVLILFGTGLFAQQKNTSAASKTVSVKVWGNCESCKTRIEKAAKINGVEKADWNIQTKILTLAYNPSIVTSEEVQKKIAAVGHDTELYKADDKAYNNLPGCCKYERKK